MNIVDIPKNYYEVDDGIMFRRVSDETIMAFNPKNGDMYELNDVSEEIISMLRNGMSGEAILAELSKNYEVEEQIIIEDVAPLLDRLVELGILILKPNIKDGQNSY